jgi:predicted tellurium resistance membrane protein TerC
LMERFPLLITIGSGLLGYVAGDMAVGDLAVKDYVETHAQSLDIAAPILGALFVVIAGKMISRRKKREPAVQAHAAPTRGETPAGVLSAER